jgi:glycosyltransferase involved in cell wall biosynthesis
LKLQEKGINTPAPIACITEKNHGLLSRSFYVSLYSDYPGLLRELGYHPLEEVKELASAFAQFTAEIHDRQVLHLDYSPGNILYKKENGQYKFCLIDINRMKFVPVDRETGCYNLRRLWGSNETIAFIAEEYAKARGFDVQKTVELTLQSYTLFWKRYAQRHHGFKPYHEQVSVIISTYNNPEWLEKTLYGYENQTFKHFDIIIADDGSDTATAQLIKRFQQEFLLQIKHVWHPDNGFQKCEILNQAIMASDADYLIFTDQDCIPREDFVENHVRYAEKGHFLSGGYFKLPMTISKQISEATISEGSIFNTKWLHQQGLKKSFKETKLWRNNGYSNLLNFITPARASWNGCNSSCWKEDALQVNGFNTEMKYGGEDREFGERLENAGLKSKQLRYTLVCLHLDHNRPYKNTEQIAINQAIRKKTRSEKIIKTSNGIKK